MRKRERKGKKKRKRKQNSIIYLLIKSLKSKNKQQMR